jgi:hypothetical protein
MSTSNAIELSWLAPNFREFSFIPNSAEELSTFFIVFLIFICAIFSLRFAYYYLETQKNLKWLLSKLKGVDKNNFAQKREELYLAAIQNKDKAIGHLWLEFNETLVEMRKDDQIVIKNTLDAGHFFNSHNLAKEVTENRLIAAVPGFLTAVGVIGTFVGLQIGLSELKLGADATVEVMKGGIAGVVDGAKIAFLTSVWGVALSVIFNFGEKFLEQRVRNRIRIIEGQVDKIFPRVRPEDQLQAIAESSQESRETLQGLAEQIGIKMQEALVTATQGIQNSLEQSLTNIMAPAINKLVNETSDGNQKALDGLITKFMDGMGAEGQEQRKALDEVSARVNESVSNMEVTLKQFVNDLQQSQANSGEREKALIADISNQVNSITSQTQNIQTTLTELIDSQVQNMATQFEQREKAASQREQELVDKIKEQVNELVINSRTQGETLANFVKSQLDGLQSSFAEREKRALDMENERNSRIEMQSKAISDASADLMQSVSATIAKHLQASDALISQGQSLQNSINAATEAGAKSAVALKESATELRVSADSIRTVGAQMSDATLKLSNTITTAVSSSAEIAKQNHTASEQIEKLRNQLNSDVEQFNQLAVKLTGLVSSAESTFGELKSSHREFIDELGLQVNKLSQDVQTSLQDYAKTANSQTAEHLKVWSNSVTEYATSMTSAVRALNNIVDSIETKLAS